MTIAVIVLILALVLVTYPTATELVSRAWCRVRGRRFGNFMWCASGVHFYPLDPRPDEVRALDIARGLANEARYAGQTNYFYSVAEHSAHVSREVERVARALGWCARDVRRAAIVALFHDAGEAYVGDVIRPLKYQRALRGYRDCERRVNRAIDAWLRSEFGFRPSRAMVELVERIDSNILSDEICVLIEGADMSAERAKWGDYLGVILHFHAPRDAERMFLTRLEGLRRWHA